MKRKILLAFCLYGVCTASNAAEWTLKPIMNPSVEYDDNVLMSSDNAESSLKFSLKPTIEAAYSTQNMNVGISMGYSISRYSSLSRLNEDDPFFRVTASKSTERSDWGLSAAYSEDASRNTAAEDTGDFDSSSVITSRTISPSYSYQLSEIDSLSLTARYSEREYSTSEFSDNETKSVSGSWQRQFSERLNGNVSVSFSNYESGTSVTGSDNDTYSFSFGANYYLSERWSFNGQVGARYLDSLQRVSGLSSSDSSSGTSFNLSATHNSQLDTVTVSASKALNPASNGDVNEQEGFSISWSRGLTETIDFSLAGSYRETVSASDGNSNKRENITIKPSISWKFSPRGNVNLNYQYRQQKRESQNTAESNAVYVGFTYDWDGYRISR